MGVDALAEPELVPDEAPLDPEDALFELDCESELDSLDTVPALSLPPDTPSEGAAPALLTEAELSDEDPKEVTLPVVLSESTETGC